MNRDSLYQTYRLRRESARASRTLDLAWRTVILVVGGTLAALGVFFLVFPGPGWATLWLGLLTLGTEFRWARRMLAPLQSAIGLVAASARNPEHRARRMHATLAAVMVLTAAAYLYIAVYGWSTVGLFEARSAVRRMLGE